MKIWYWCANSPQAKSVATAIASETIYDERNNAFRILSSEWLLEFQTEPRTFEFTVVQNKQFFQKYHICGLVNTKFIR